MTTEWKSPAEKYGFPFEPYDIQISLMGAVSSCLEKGGVGIFESPTGTGKSLSLACAAGAWLKKSAEEDKAKLAELEKQEAEAGEADDWLAALDDKQAAQEESAALREGLETLESIRARIAEAEAFPAQEDARPVGKRPITDTELQQEKEEDEDLIPEEPSPSTAPDKKDPPLIRKIFYASRTHSQLAQFLEEVKKTRYRDLRAATIGSRRNLCVNPSVLRLRTNGAINERCLEMQKGSSSSKVRISESGRPRKAISSAKCPSHRREAEKQLADHLLHASLEVEDVVKLGKTHATCPYYATREAIPDAELVLLPYQLLLNSKTRLASGIDLRNSLVIIDEAHNLLSALASTHSVRLGGGDFATAAACLAHYLLRFRTRLSPGNLRSLRQLLTFVRSLESLCRTTGQTSTTTPSTNKATTTTAKTTSIMTTAKTTSSTTTDKTTPTMSTAKTSSTRILTPPQLAWETGIADLNLAELAAYMDASHIARKLLAFAAKYTPEVDVKTKDLNSIYSDSEPGLKQSGLARLFAKKEPDSEPGKSEPGKTASASPLFQIRALLDCLCLEPGEGRILLADQTLEFFLLSPGRLFKSVVSESRAVVLAGGTMEPSTELERALKIGCSLPPDRLTRFSCGHVIGKGQMLALAIGAGPTGPLKLTFATRNQPQVLNEIGCSLPPDRLTRFSCGHVIGKGQMLALAIGAGPTGPLKLTFATRNQPQVFNEVGRILEAVVSRVPAGCVLFVPSYDYLDTLYQKLEKSVFTKSGTTSFLAKKRVFREPRQPDQTTKVWEGYSRCAKEGAGALMLAVVGGKMSEGINFADDLGRAVIVLGLPYPNKTSPILKERMSYLESISKGAGDTHYESLCLSAVNQSIGRAIRHRGDHAAVVLLDARYTTARIREQLPAWIRSSLKCHEKAFQPALDDLTAFFGAVKCAK